MGENDSLLAQRLNLKEFIDYQDNSVVSKTLIDKGVGTVTFFAFDAGQGLSEHTAPFDALVQIVDGQADITISSQSYTVKEGECIIMPAHQPHAVKAPERFKMLLSMIKE